MTKALPFRSKVCQHCGLLSAATSHGSVGECVDALQHEVARLRDRTTKANRVPPSFLNVRGIGTMQERRRLGSVGLADPHDLQLPSGRRVGPRRRSARLQTNATIWSVVRDATRISQQWAFTR